MLAALSASGLPADEFTFLGFPPNRGNDRKKWLDRAAAELRTLIIYEAPHRIQRTLADLMQVLGDRTVAIGRELTKAHEELVVRPISGHIASLPEPRGEYTLVIQSAPPVEIGCMTYSEEAISNEYAELLRSGLAPRAAVRELAQRYSLASRLVYGIVHRTGDGPCS